MSHEAVITVDDKTAILSYSDRERAFSLNSVTLSTEKAASLIHSSIVEMLTNLPTDKPLMLRLALREVMALSKMSAAAMSNMPVAVKQSAVISSENVVPNVRPVKQRTRRSNAPATKSQPVAVSAALPLESSRKIIFYYLFHLSSGGTFTRDILQSTQVSADKVADSIVTKHNAASDDKVTGYKSYASHSSRHGAKAIAVRYSNEKQVSSAHR